MTFCQVAAAAGAASASAEGRMSYTDLKSALKRSTMAAPGQALLTHGAASSRYSPPRHCECSFAVAIWHWPLYAAGVAPCYLKRHAQHLMRMYTQVVCCCVASQSLSAIPAARRKLSLARNVKCESCQAKGTKSGRQYTCEVRRKLLLHLSSHSACAHPVFVQETLFQITILTASEVCSRLPMPACTLQGDS